MKSLDFSLAAMLFKLPRQMKTVNREPSALGAGNKGESLAGAR